MMGNRLDIENKGIIPRVGETLFQMYDEKSNTHNIKIEA